MTLCGREASLEALEIQHGRHDGNVASSRECVRDEVMQWSEPGGGLAMLMRPRGEEERPGTQTNARRNEHTASQCARDRGMGHCWTSG